MSLPPVYFWKKAPFIKILPALIIGIMWSWQAKPNSQTLLFTAFTSVFIVLLFFFIPFFRRFKLRIIAGLAISVLFFCLGALLVKIHDVRFDKNGLLNQYHENDIICAHILEPLTERSATFKTTAEVIAVTRNGTRIPTHGYILVYFKKDSIEKDIDYGTELFFKNPLQLIRSSGNPGGFD